MFLMMNIFSSKILQREPGSIAYWQTVFIIFGHEFFNVIGIETHSEHRQCHIGTVGYTKSQWHYSFLLSAFCSLLSLTHHSLLITHYSSLILFSLKLLATTLTELNAIAAPAIMGSSKNWLTGYNIPAAMGMPIRL